MTGGQVLGINEALGALRSVLPITEQAAYVGMARGVAGGASIVRGKASGRPGPRNITGDYRRSITSSAERQPGRVLGQIGSNAAQARRLEYGFMNRRDILGRLYHQPPYPHFKPSEPEVVRLVVDQITKAVQGKLSHP